MISIVCVYNNGTILENCLLRGLKSQTAKHELILIDNRKGRFKSAAEAFNSGGHQAKGKYILFAHADIVLTSADYLEHVEKTLDSISDLGVAGIAGLQKNSMLTVSNSLDGFHPPKPAGSVRITGPAKAKTLDGCLLFVPRTVFETLEFDEKTCSDWHLYDADYCLAVAKRGLGVYVLPEPVYHRSIGASMSESYFPTLEAVIKKHGNTGWIYASMGAWNRILPLRLRRMRAVQLSMRIPLILFHDGAAGLSTLLFNKRNFHILSYILFPYIYLKMRALPFWQTKESLVNFAFFGAGGILRPAQVKEEISRLMEIVEKSAPKTIVEVSPAYGSSLFLLSRAAPDSATLIHVQVPGMEDGKTATSMGLPLHGAYSKRGQKIRLIRPSNSENGDTSELSSFLGGGKIDFLFIDGDHTYDGVKKDFQMYSRFVRDGGIIAFHDIAGHPFKTLCGANKFWQELKSAHDSTEIIQGVGQGWAGIGVIFKKASAAGGAAHGAAPKMP